MDFYKTRTYINMKLSEMSMYHGHNKKKNADRTVKMSICLPDSYPLVLFSPDLNLFVQWISNYLSPQTFTPWDLPQDMLEFIIFVNIQMMVIEKFSYKNNPTNAGLFRFSNIP